MNKKIEAELENQFPKGHKSRGRALVLHAVAQIEIESLKNFSNAIKRLIRNTGRSSMVSISDIEELIKEHLK